MNVQKYWKGILAALGNNTGAKNIDEFQKKAIVALGSASLKKSQITALTSLTNSSGGTANDTVESIPAATAASTDTSAASLASTNTSLTAIRNDVADLTVKVNAIITALKA